MVENRINSISTDIELETKRVEFNRKYKKNQIIQYAVLGGALLIIFLLFFLLIRKSQHVFYFFIGILVLFVGLFIYSKINRKYKSKIIESFVNDYREYERKIVYNDVADLKIDSFEIFGKIENDKIVGRNIFNQVDIIESNNIVLGYYLDNKFESASVVIYKDKTNKVFSGKYYEFTIDRKLEGKIVLEICKDKKLDLNYNGLTKYNLQNFEKVDIYSNLEKDDVNKYFTKKIQKEINDIVITEDINNVCIFISGNKLVVLTSTKEKYVDVNVKKEIDKETFISLKKHFLELISLRKTL